MKKHLLALGRGEYGRVGNNSNKANLEPLLVQFASSKTNDNDCQPNIPNDVLHIACGAGHSICCTESGHVYTFGKNYRGQLGLGHDDDVLQATQIDPQFFEHNKIVSVAGAGNTSFFVSNNGKVFTCGTGFWCCTGLGREQMAIDRPQLIQGLSEVVVTKIAVGELHCLAITQDHHLYSWGRNDLGQCGVGQESPKTIRVPTKIMADVSEISCGYDFSSACTTQGDMYVWGDTSKAPLGLDSEQRAHTKKPQRINYFSENQIKISRTSCSEYHLIAQAVDTRVFSWGSNQFHQTGHKDCSRVETPREIEFLRDKQIVSFAAGVAHSVFVSACGRLYCVGDRNFGNETWDQPSSYLMDSVGLIPGISYDQYHFTQVSCGNWHTLLIANQKD